MSLIDILFAGSLVAHLFWRSRVTICLALLTAILQFLLEGLYWQFIPALLLLLVSIRFRLNKLASATLFTISLTPWFMLPVPVLPNPSGKYPVGTRTFRFISPDGIVQAWYPAANPSNASHAPYMDGLNQLPPKVGFLPRFIFWHFDEINTRATSESLVSTDQPLWPVIIFSHGYGGARAFYTGLLTSLASQGYIVLAIDHPYEAAITQLATGQIVTPVERFRTMEEQLELRANDIASLLQRLPKLTPVYPHMDLNYLIAAGHSFGGATAVVAMHRHPQIRAAINIDGTLYGDILKQTLNRPYLCIQSDYANTHHSSRFIEGNQRLESQSNSTASHIEIPNTNHYSFTDLPLFFSRPGRLLLSIFLGGNLSPSESQQQTIHHIRTFLSRNSLAPR